MRFRMRFLLFVAMVGVQALAMGETRNDRRAAIETPPVKFTTLSEDPDSRIAVAAFRPARDQGSTVFVYREGVDLGLSDGFDYGIRDYTDPFWIGRGTAGGDYDRDGWQDLIFGTNHGFALFRNIGGRFQLQPQTNPQLLKLQVYAVAFADMNNDQWLDIFFTTFNKGNYIVLNKQGEFDFTNPVPVPNQNAVLTLSPAMADLDGNGQLDILNGNIALGVVTGFNHMRARRNNSLVFNGNLQFRDVALETTSGETMASLISDINNDEILDIYFGNDFIIPDKILLGTGKGYKPVVGSDFIPFTPFFSMGADTGDVNNDLTLDFVITGTMYMAPFVGREPIDGKSVAEYSRFKGDADTCNGIEDQRYRTQCLRIRNANYIEALDNAADVSLSRCQKIADDIDKDVCLTRLMWKLTRDEIPQADCRTEFASDERLLAVCEILALKERRYDKRDLYGAIPQDDRNMLYIFDPQSKSFRAVIDFKHPGGWTWNSKIVDLDNDGWQDIVTSDGTVRKSDYGWNVLMKNINGERFEQQQFSAGFANDFALYSFVLIDIDNDGDLDIVGNSAEGPIQVYLNQTSGGNHSVAVSLHDEMGNVFGIGAKITIHYNQGKNAQIRELKAGGGYMSFDPPVAYFGLGSVRDIDEIRVLWPDNTLRVYAGPFDADRHYRIERPAPRRVAATPTSRQDTPRSSRTDR